MGVTNINKVISQSKYRHIVVLMIILLLAPTLTFAQEAPAPEEEVDAPEDEEQDISDQTDPRILARKEQERRERIERLSRRPSQLPREGQSLTSSNVPLGLQSQQGIQVGRTLLTPSAFLGGIYTDNANSTEDNRESDVLLGGSANLRADALLRRHALGAQATVTAASSLEGTDDDVFGWQVGADGRYDLSRQSSFNAAVSGSLAQEADSSVEAEGSDAEVNNYSGGVGYQFLGRRLIYGLNATIDRADFSGEATADRDRTTYSVSGRAVRLVSDRLALFFSPQYSIDSFDTPSDDDGIDRDSSQATAVVGADYQPRPRLVLGAALGYSRTFFEASDVDDESTIVGSLSSAYTYDSRTEITLAISRQSDVTTADNATSETVTAATGGVTRQLSADQVISASTTYALSDFSGTNRNDHNLTAELGYFHRLTPNLVLNLGYQFETRLSDIDNNDFYENQVSVGLNITY